MREVNAVYVAREKLGHPLQTGDAGIRVDGAVESAITEMKAYHMTERATARDAMP